MSVILGFGCCEALVALAATRALRAHLSRWEAQLVAEAMADGATWEEVGQAIGASRQAAWERFHDDVDSPRRSGSEARKRYEGEVRRLRREVSRLKRGGAAR